MGKILNKSEVICLHSVEWFQILQWDISSFIDTQFK